MKDSMIDLSGIDQSLAIEEIEKLFQGDLIANLNSRRFSRFSKIYPFATENLAGYMLRLDLDWKEVLTVSASGDHIINAYNNGAKSVTGFDCDLLSGLFCDLKFTGLQAWGFEEFKRFFMLGPEAFRYETYRSIRDNISPITRLFFDLAYKHFRGNGAALRRSNVFKNDMNNTPERSIFNNPYLQSAANYDLTRKHQKPAAWHLSPVQNLADVIDGSYDRILLSNIADYAREMFEGANYLESFAGKVVVPLSKRLKPKGLICAGYVYNARTGQPGEDTVYRTDIDDPKKRREILSGLGMKYEELTFESGINGIRDAVITLQRRK